MLSWFLIQCTEHSHCFVHLLVPHEMIFLFCSSLEHFYICDNGTVSEKRSCQEDGRIFDPIARDCTETVLEGGDLWSFLFYNSLLLSISVTQVVQCNASPTVRRRVPEVCVPAIWTLTMTLPLISSLPRQSFFFQNQILYCSHTFHTSLTLLRVISSCSLKLRKQWKLTDSVKLKGWSQHCEGKKDYYKGCLPKVLSP